MGSSKIYLPSYVFFIYLIDVCINLLLFYELKSIDFGTNFLTAEIGRYNLTGFFINYFGLLDFFEISIVFYLLNSYFNFAVSGLSIFKPTAETGLN